MATDNTCVAFWFGRQLFLQLPDEVVVVELPEKDDPIATVVTALAERERRPKSVRLVFQPVGFTPEADVQLVKGGKEKNRETLKQPEIKNPSTAWAISRPVATENGRYQGFLWIDKAGLLTRLRSELAQKGIALEGAWSLVSVLETMDPTSSEGVAVLACIFTDGGAYFYAAAPSGSRSVGFVSGAGYRSAFAQAINPPLQKMGASRPSLLLIQEAEVPLDLSKSKVADIEPIRRSLTDLFAAVRKLPTASPGNFVTKQVLIEARYLVYAATAVLFLAAAITAGAYVWEYRRILNDSEAQKQQAKELREETTKLTANKDEIEKVNAMEKELNLRAKGHVQFLTAAMDARPREITVHTLTFDETGFSMTGTAHDLVGQAASPFAAFVGKLGWVAPAVQKDGSPAPTADSGPAKPWTFDGGASPPVLREPDFTVTGRWAQ